jgi:23S rRNA (cytidine1920-2'-O)/16S rRNA (cytidine1409-2'-O)-methyltransferase
LKIRIDKLLTERGLAPSRERAQALILAGRVLADEQKVTKSGASVDDGVTIRILGDDLRFVSRGGLKLERALDHWKIEVRGKMCMDVGTSTGGFTDCMLQRGAARVIAVDTGYGQVDVKLRNDPRVTLLEKTNARFLTAETVGQRVEFVAMDVSFISATLVLPSVVSAGFQGDHGEIVVLVKPQFEVGRRRVGKGGIVREESARLEAVEKVRNALATLGGVKMEVIDSPILGTAGNREFLLYAQINPK